VYSINIYNYIKNIFKSSNNVSINNNKNISTLSVALGTTVTPSNIVIVKQNSLIELIKLLFKIIGKLINLMIILSMFSTVL